MKNGLLFTFIIWIMSETCFAGVTVSSNEQWTNLFFGEEANFTFSISSDESFKGSAGWRFSMGSRTISRGEIKIDVGPMQSQSLPVRMPVPEGKEGVSLPGLVTISVYDAQNRNVASIFEKKIWIYSKYPFKNKNKWLKKLNLFLFDPNEKTAEILSKSDIIFKEIFNKEALSDIENGIVLIGEGISLPAYPGLIQMLIERAESGIPVICLAPAEGAIPLPGAVSSIKLHGPSSILFRQNNIIKRFDKKLDADAWPPDGRIIASCLRLTEEKMVLSALANKNNQGWPWMEIQYKKRNGRFIVCGFAIVEKWDTGPVPRNLFLRLLEYVDETDSD